MPAFMLIKVNKTNDCWLLNSRKTMIEFEQTACKGSRSEQLPNTTVTSVLYF